MFHQADHDLKDAKIQLKTAEAELDELNQQLKSFESVVDARLGSLLDQLSELNAETSALDEQLRHIREERLFGTELMHYLEGAPQPARPRNLSEIPHQDLPHRSAIHTRTQRKPTIEQPHIPDIKAIYRRLARRYHPDLARNDADRTQSTQHMKEINQAYAAGDLQAMMRLAGMTVPYGVSINLTQEKLTGKPEKPMNELEEVERKLQAVRLQIISLTNLPIVKLSLDVKLARHQGRDLLHEMAAEFKYKVARKLAERDYLRSQIDSARGQINQDTIIND